MPNIIARPGPEGGESLLAHSEAVAKRLPGLLSLEDMADTSEDTFLEGIGYLHDLGKATTYFQRHVRGTYVEHEERTYHARIGGLAAFYVFGSLDVPDRDRLAACLAILRHHGRIPDASEYLTNTIVEPESAGEGYATQQVSDIDTHPEYAAVANELLHRATDGTEGWSEFATVVRDGSLFTRLESAVNDAESDLLVTNTTLGSLPDHLYDRTIRIWSALTFADKTAAAQLDTNTLTSKELSLSDLEAHIESVRSGLDDPPSLNAESLRDMDVSDEGTLNQVRECIRRHVRTQVPRLRNDSSSIATLTLPTGLGKTFTGLTAAYELRDSLEHSELGTDTPPRVIYALPYTSIIEQTRDLFEAPDIFDADPQGLRFTVHHYLSDTLTYPDIDSADGEPDATTTSIASYNAALLGESWRSGTILTTFVQLFDSLVGPTNAQGLKLSALQDSVIILDEPQTLPKSWWEGIRYLVRLLVDEYDVHVISMTATQPSLLTAAANLQTTSLLSKQLDDDQSLREWSYSTLTRTEYAVDDSLAVENGEFSGITHEAAATRLADTLTQAQPGQDDSTLASVLAVCNTVASAHTLATALSDTLTMSHREVTSIGDAYRRVLQANSPNPSTNPIDPNDRPEASRLAEATLRELGFTHCGDSDNPLSPDAWAYDPEPQGEQRPVYLGMFSSRLRPYDRRALVAVADVLSQSPVPFAFVSTQAIEAGVDISFQYVYRDIAPLDSIVQAAGRCNRSFEWGLEGGRAHVWVLDSLEDAATRPAEQIYNPKSQLVEVARILRAYQDQDAIIPEPKMTLDAVPDYFDWVEAHDFEDRELTSALEDCQGNILQGKQLIDDDTRSRDVIVTVTPFEQALLEAIHDPAADTIDFDLLSLLADLRISIPERDAEMVSSRLPRLDKRTYDDSDGVSVLQCTTTGPNAPYDLADGGFIVDLDEAIDSRFT